VTNPRQWLRVQDAAGNDVTNKYLPRPRQPEGQGFMNRTTRRAVERSRKRRKRPIPYQARPTTVVVAGARAPWPATPTWPNKVTSTITMRRTKQTRLVTWASSPALRTRSGAAIPTDLKRVGQPRLRRSRMTTCARARAVGRTRTGLGVNSPHGHSAHCAQFFQRRAPNQW
jgi:hypothetical protein